MLTLLQNVQVYAPRFLGRQDLLLAGGKICSMRECIRLDSNVPVTVVDGEGRYLLPGFIDCHVHIAGGGGEGGFATRTPPIRLTDITTAGVTTVVGTLGTDGTTRSMPELLAKANALEEEGITTFIQTGSYHLPLRTLTGSVTDDLVFIPKVIGAGEVAVADHRSSCPTAQELARLASQVRLGAMLAGKAGTVNLHMGDSRRMLALLEEVLQESDIPMRHFVPTHMNRNPYLFEKAMEYAAKGGNVDFTTSTVPAYLEEGEIAAYHTLKRLKEKGIPLAGVTFTSDGQGSLPRFNEQGEICGLDVGKVSSLFQSVADAVRKDGLTLEEALPVITENPARIYGLQGKGHVEEGFDADLVLVEPDTLAIHSVIAKGRFMVRDGKAVVTGAYH